MDVLDQEITEHLTDSLDGYHRRVIVQNAKFGFVSSAFFGVPLSFYLSFNQFSSWLLFLIFHIATAIVSLLFLFVFKTNTHNSIKYRSFNIFGSLMLCTYALMVSTYAEDISTLFVGNIVLAVFSINTLIWFPSRHLSEFLLHFASCLISAYFITTKSLEINNALLLGIHLFAIGTGTVLYFERLKSFADFIQVGFRWVREMIPDQVYRTKQAQSVKVEYRESFFVCSDWRGYQALSKNLSPEEITGLLSAYYTMVDRILINVFGLTGYYSDWIADELFISIEYDGKTSRKETVEKVRDFCRLVNKGIVNDLKQEGVITVDFGLSFGPAITGYIGPENHKKMTSLGEAPGSSRRLQSMGRQVRNLHGENSYLIFDQEEFKMGGEKKSQHHIKDMGLIDIYALALNTEIKEKATDKKVA